MAENPRRHRGSSRSRSPRSRKHRDEHKGSSSRRKRSKSRSRSRSNPRPRRRSRERHDEREENNSNKSNWKPPFPVSRANQNPGFWYAVRYNPLEAGSIDGTDSRPHDHGIVRALNAKYDASRDPSIKGNPTRTIFVGRLNFQTSEETLQEAFAKYGEICRLRLVRDIVTGQSRGYAFIEFKTDQQFLHAYRSAHGLTIDGREILVDYERERLMEGWVPRRLGGGLGGRKESGQLRFGGRDRPFKTPLSVKERRDAGA
eukprot:TRINITY_DN13246_c0_g1_i1.p1 TRINITY_DN13246_c0_g1~~TRINITY_DN13246_c0_g1_i1.p1  ORF type:complete len:274 (-),score=8.01 TRINITY_DN13246_c0_g1_i1:337-1110(-)